MINNPQNHFTYQNICHTAFFCSISLHTQKSVLLSYASCGRSEWVYQAVCIHDVTSMFFSKAFGDTLVCIVYDVKNTELSIYGDGYNLIQMVL